MGKHGSHGVLHLGLVVQEKLKTVENEVSIKMSQLFKSTVVILKKKKRKKKEHAVIAYGHSLYYTDLIYPLGCFAASGLLNQQNLG